MNQRPGQDPTDPRNATGLDDLIIDWDSLGMADPTQQPGQQVDLNQVLAALQNNPVAKQAALGLLMRDLAPLIQQQQQQPGGPSQQAGETLTPRQKRIQELTAVLEQNPSDAKSWQEWMQLSMEEKAEQAAQQHVAPLVQRTQLTQQLDGILDQWEAKARQKYPNFDQYRGAWRGEMKAILLEDPTILNNPQQMGALAQLQADRAAAAWLRSQGSGLQGARPQGSGGSTLPQGLITSAVKMTPAQKADYERARQYYPDLTPEDWLAYQNDDRQYDLSLRNVLQVGPKKGGDQ